MNPELPFPKSKLLAAAFLFEKPRMALNSFDQTEIVEAGLLDADPCDIAAQISTTLDSIEGLPASYRITAFWALGKKFDSQLLRFFQRHLAIEVNRDPEVTYQIMIALDNLEQKPWPEHLHSFSSNDHEINSAAARDYLQRSGF